MLNVIIWLLFISLYIPIFADLYSFRWQLIDYTHAYFILPISVIFSISKINQAKQYIKDQKPIDRIFGFILLSIGIFFFLFGSKNEYLLISTLSIIFVAFGLIFFNYGAKVARLFVFPIFYLLLLVPPPIGLIDNITLPLRHIITFISEFILKSFHFPIYREGLILFIGNQQIYIDAPCSGIRSLITILSLSILYVNIKNFSFKNKIILITISIVLAWLGNILRVLTICLLTYYLGEEIAQGFLHKFSSILIFTFTFLGILYFDSILKED